MVKGRGQKQAEAKRRAALKAARLSHESAQTYKAIGGHRGPVRVAPVDQRETVSISAAVWSGDYRYKQGHFVLTRVHRGTPPGVLTFGYIATNEIVDDFLSSVRMPQFDYKRAQDGYWPQGWKFE